VVGSGRVGRVRMVVLDGASEVIIAVVGVECGQDRCLRRREYEREDGDDGGLSALSQ